MQANLFVGPGELDVAVVVNPPRRRRFRPAVAYEQDTVRETVWRRLARVRLPLVVLKGCALPPAC